MTWRNVDLSFMHNGKIAVNCRTKEELVVLMTAIKKEYPQYEHTCTIKSRLWESDRDKDGLSVRAIASGEGSVDFGHCWAEWYRRNGYTVVEFRDICKGMDLGEIISGYDDMSAALEALF